MIVGDAHDVSLPHDHLFYELEPSTGRVSVPAQRTFARLYLATLMLMLMCSVKPYGGFDPAA